MLMSFFIWMLGKFGVAPTPADLQRMDRQFRERGHHIMVDFGGQRIGGTRWSDPDFEKLFIVGVGYEYLVDRRYNGVSVEVVGQSLGRVFHTGDHEWFVGGGLGYYPTRHWHLFVHGGALFEPKDVVRAAGRVGVGYRFMFFHLGMQPFFYLQTDSGGQFGWALAFRFEY